MIWIDSDTVVRWLAMSDSVSGALITDATVTGVLANSSGTALVSFPLTGGTGGNYSGVITASQASTLATGTNYILTVTATRTGNQTERRVVDEKADFRGVA